MNNSIYIDRTLRSYYAASDGTKQTSAGNGYLDMLKSMVTKTEEAEEKAVQDMTMDEYKSYISGVLNNLPMDKSRENSTAAVIISNAGWLRMKEDPAYETFVVNEVAKTFASEDPWDALGSNSCTIFRFGDNENKYQKDEWGKDFPGDIKTYLQWELMNTSKTTGSSNIFMKIAKKRIMQNNQNSLNDLASHIASLQNLSLLSQNKNSLFLANAQNSLLLLSALNSSIV